MLIVPERLLYHVSLLQRRKRLEIGAGDSEGGESFIRSRDMLISNSLFFLNEGDGRRCRQYSRTQ
jgi:hypothetical protein